MKRLGIEGNTRHFGRTDNTTSRQATIPQPRRTDSLSKKAVVVCRPWATP